MFRKLYEGYEEPLPAPATQLNRYFNYTEPGTIRSNKATPPNLSEAQYRMMDVARLDSTQRDLQKATNTAINGQFGAPFMKGLANHFLGFQVPKTIVELQEKCKAKTLNQIIAGYDDQSFYNCGFVYDKDKDPYVQNDGVGRGYLGDKTAPVNYPSLNPVPSGTYYWDAKEAKKAADIAKCDTIKACGHLDSSPYRNGCAWCKTIGRAIPVNSNGVALYTGPNLTCDRASLTMTGEKCPPEAVAAPLTDPSGQVCSDFKLSRDCIISYARTAGCSDNGTLITALKAGNSATNYADQLASNRAYQVYQDRLTGNLNPSMFEAGNAAIDVVTANLAALKTEAMPGGTTATAYAARDLCLNAGEIDKFDFCAADIQADAKSPFGLKCLQQAFRLAGGQGEGTMYPRDQKMVVMYSTNFNKWSEVIAYFNKLKEDCSSTDVAVQEKALREFLGVKRESLYNPTVPKYANYEVYNFSSLDVNNGLDAIFIGRTIQQAADGLPKFNTSMLTIDSKVTQLDKQSKTSFVLLTDLRPGDFKTVKFAFDTKDGVVLTVNKDMVNYANDLTVNEEDYFSRNQVPLTPIFVYNTAATKLNPNGNNRVKVYWNNQIAGALKTFRMLYLDGNSTDTNDAKLIPNNWVSMTQEPEAPMLSFEVSASSIAEKRLPEFFTVTANSISMDSTNYDKTNTLLDRPNTPFMNFTGTSSSFIVNKLIRSTAFSAITIKLRINQANVAGNVFSFGNMSLDYNTNNTLVLSVKGIGSTTVPIYIGIWYIAVIRVSGSNQYSRNKLNFDVIELATIKPGVSVELNKSGLSGSIDKSGNNILDLITNNNMLALGNGRSVPMSVASLRLYDQSIDDVAVAQKQNISGIVISKDARNTFKRNWYN